jgi:hypothetical protein
MERIINVKETMKKNQAEEMTRNVVAFAGSLSLLTIAQEIGYVMKYFGGLDMSATEIAKRMADRTIVSWDDLCVLAAYLKFHARNMTRLGEAFEAELCSCYRNISNLDESKSSLLMRSIAISDGIGIMDDLIDDAIIDLDGEPIFCSDKQTM